MRSKHSVGRGRQAALVVVAGLPMAAPLGILSALAPRALAQGDPLKQPFPATLELADLDGANGFRAHGVTAEDNSGRSVATAGDFNGDGIDDLLIGAPGGDGPRDDNVGWTYVVFGRDDGDFGASLDLSSLDGRNGLRMEGVELMDSSGLAAASAGDVNGDGIDDVVIGAWLARPGGGFAGSSYVVFGRDLPGGDRFEPVLGLGDLDGSRGFRMDGAGDDQSGYAVASAGDLNDDGIDDVIIGARQGDFGRLEDVGVAYVVFGRDGDAGERFPDVIDLAGLDGEDGFVIGGIAPGDGTGRSVAPAGDVDGDGVDDVIIGAYFADPRGRNNAGSSFVIYGRDRFDATLSLADLDDRDGFRINGVADGDASGISVAPAGDVNGDGVGDVIIGASSADPGGQSRAGAAYIVFGRDAGSGERFPPVFDLADLDDDTGVRFEGAAADDRAGSWVASAGDVNADGVDDAIIGAERADPPGRANAGESYVIFGRAGGVGGSLPAVVEPGDLDGVTGFRLRGAAQGDESGDAVATAGDLNADGVDDLVIGAWLADPSGLDGAGSSSVVFGRTPIDCPADLNGDGALNIFDFLAFQNLFAAGDPAADFDGDGDFTIFDFLAFQNAFGAGCP